MKHIKNIVLDIGGVIFDDSDIGGVIFDDSKKNIEKLLGKNCDVIYKLAYGKSFKECLLGNKKVNEHIESLSNYKEFEDLKYILSKKNLSKSYPLITTNFEYIKTLKKQGYKLYLLTNITEDSYNYINDLININSIFDGGIYSYQEHIIKPDKRIFNLLIDKYNLKRSETIFFDDKDKNVISAINQGISSYVFKSIEDIKNNI